MVAVSLKKNLFFDSWNGDIDVFQSEHINFCNHNKVKDCVTDRSTQLRDLIFHLYNKESLLSYLILRAIYYTDTKLNLVKQLLKDKYVTDRTLSLIHISEPTRRS